MINKFLIYIIFFVNFSFLVKASSEIPFPNMFITKTPITYKAEIEFKGFEGEPINLSNYNNEIYLLNFWASWCAPCKKEHKFLMKLSKSEKLKILGVNFKDKSTSANKFINQLGNPYYLIAKDEDGKSSVFFGVYGIPESILVDKNLVVLKKYIGQINNDDVKEILQIIENK